MHNAKQHNIVPQKYGVVYTPRKLADFAAYLLAECAKRHHVNCSFVIDPACGEGSLLTAVSTYLPKANLIGIDVDKTIEASMSYYKHHYISDFILPTRERNQLSHEFWLTQLPKLDALIANPPWSSEHIYSKQTLHKNGFSLANRQYDSYELFVELGIKILRTGGFYAFILPDSLFSPEKSILRKWILENTELKVVARLGEKIFPDVFRATVIIVGRNVKPTSRSKTCCYRLDTISRNKFLADELDLRSNFIEKRHYVFQRRFTLNPLFNIDVDTTSEDAAITKQMSRGNLTLGDLFVFGRGVELSKKGFVEICPSCGAAQGVRHSPSNIHVFECKHCHQKRPFSNNLVHQIVFQRASKGTARMWVGESVDRYLVSAPRFIVADIAGIDYKTPDLYAPPKLLIRKTGLGIYAAVDSTRSLTNQTVYILRPLKSMALEEMYYYLAFINSRAMYYYYQKMYGAAEWKSHPYLTKQVIFSLPVPACNMTPLDKRISALSRSLSKEYSRDIDLKLERLILKRYGLRNDDIQRIKEIMSQLPPLSSIQSMHF